MKIKKALQECSLRKSRSRSPFNPFQSKKPTKMIEETMTDEDCYSSDLTPIRSGGLVNKATNDSEKEPVVEPVIEVYDVPSNLSQAPKEGTCKDGAMSQPGRMVIDELSHVNKYLHQENAVLRLDVHHMDERVEQLERFLEECKKAKADPIRDTRPVKDEDGEYWRVRNENTSMSETMKVMAKLVQRQEKSLQRHRKQAVAHQSQLRERRRFIQKLEKELVGRQQILFETRTKDLEYRKRVESLQRQIKYMEKQIKETQLAQLEGNARSMSSEDDIDVKKILYGFLPKTNDDLPSVDHSYESSSSAESTQSATSNNPLALHSKTSFEQTLEGVKKLKISLEEEHIYLLSQHKLADDTMSTESEYSATESPNNVVQFKPNASCYSGSEVTFEE